VRIKFLLEFSSYQFELFALTRTVGLSLHWESQGRGRDTKVGAPAKGGQRKKQGLGIVLERQKGSKGGKARVLLQEGKGRIRGKRVLGTVTGRVWF